MADVLGRSRKKRPRKRGKAVSNQSAIEVALGSTELPDDMLKGQTIDLQQWSSAVTDSSLERIAEFNRTTSSEDTFNAIKNPKKALSPFELEKKEESKPRLRMVNGKLTAETLLSLNIAGADMVTDFGLKRIAVKCTKLKELLISGCTGITDVGLRCIAMGCPLLEKADLHECVGLMGAGLVAVAENCKGLAWLDLRGLVLEDWVLRRIADGCVNLRHINFHAQRHGLDDEALGAIALHTPLLQELDLGHCVGISDVGLLAVANHCPNLESLNIARKELAYKVTDVCLLAFAEKCQSLRSLNLSGCHKISDVGLSWLTNGCRGIRKLDLTRCSEISDAGIRQLSEHCFELEWLSLAHLKKLSDVGLRHLGERCKKLKHLDCTGLFLLTDGVTRDFGLEGVLALADGCRDLKSLVLAGCFRVAKLAFRALAQHCTTLQSLNLSGCVKTTPEGLKALFCAVTSSLTSLSLSGCEKVGDNTLATIGREAYGLISLNLSGCERITDSGVRWLIRGCKRLQKLNFSGCKGVKDLSLLCLAEGNLEPGLSHLNLSGCVDISETGVSWLSERCPTLISLNVKGCAVTVPGLEAMRENWRYVELRNDAHYLGIAPQHRCLDHRFQEFYGHLWRAALKIQSKYRATIAVNTAMERRRQRLKNWVASKVQAMWRGIQARKLAAKERAHKNFLCKMARRMQAFWRCVLAKRILAVLRGADFARRCWIGAEKIQALWKGQKTRRVLAAFLEKRRRQQKRKLDSTHILQRAWRGYVHRKKFQVLYAAHRAVVNHRNKNARQVQRIFRGFLGRAKSRRRRVELRMLAKKRVLCAIKIQGVIRGRFGRKIVAMLRRYDTEREEAALVVQSAWRARLGRKFLQFQRVILQAARRNTAALRIQTKWRGRCGSLAVQLLQAGRRQLAIDRERSARTIQRVMRGALARKEARFRRQLRDEELAKKRGLLIWGATTIQRIFRGVQGRLYCRRVKKAHMRRWKRLWDTEQNRPFYYDQTTGEIRWRMPQELLDLQPKPPCSNCDDAMALLECSECSEYYCHACWEQVHSGGKRRSHQFRSLYDAYEKRVDYGDGEFPSRWPTEISQDEFKGWTLFDRDSSTAESAHTILETGGWIKLTDPSDYPFYWHPTSNSSSYMRPEGFETPREQIADTAMIQMLASVGLATASQPVVDDSDVVVSKKDSRDPDLLDWREKLDPETGEKFYCEFWRKRGVDVGRFADNMETGEISLSRPAEYRTPRKRGARGKEAELEDGDGERELEEEEEKLGEGKEEQSEEEAMIPYEEEEEEDVEELEEEEFVSSEEESEDGSTGSEDMSLSESEVDAAEESF